MGDQLLQTLHCHELDFWDPTAAYLFSYFLTFDQSLYPLGNQKSAFYKKYKFDSNYEKELENDVSLSPFSINPNPLKLRDITPCFGMFCVM